MSPSPSSRAPVPSDTPPSPSESEEIAEVMGVIPVGVKAGPFYALSFRNYRLFFVGQTISVIGTWMQNVAQQWLIWQLTHSAAWLGIVNGASAIPYAAFAISGGQAADRYARRNILVWTQALAMVLAFILAGLASNRWIPVQAWHVAALAGLASIINAYNMPAQQAFVTDMVDDRAAMPNAIALNSLRFNLARFIGPIFAGLVLVRMSVSACFFLNGVSFIAVIISLWMMRIPPFVPQTRSIAMWDGVRYIWENKVVFRVVALVGAGAMLTWPLSTIFPVFAERMGQGASGYSQMMSANGVGAALGGLFLATIGVRFSRYVMVYGGSLLFSITAIIFTMTTHHLPVLAVLVVSGFMMILFGISANIKVQEDVPDDLRGRVMAIHSLVFQGLFSLGGLQLGLLAQKLSAPVAVQMSAVLSVVITLGLLFWSQKARAVPRTQP